MNKKASVTCQGRPLTERETKLLVWYAAEQMVLGNIMGVATQSEDGWSIDIDRVPEMYIAVTSDDLTRIANE